MQNQDPEYEFIPQHPTFKKYYEKDGQIKNIKTDHIISIQTDKHGYKYIMIRNNNKTHKVRLHRFIYECHKGLIPNGYVIDHIDNNKQNNSINNLQMVTQKANIIKKYAGGVHFNNKKKAVEAINTNNNEKSTYKSISSAGKAINITPPSVRRCCERQQKTAIQRGTGIRYNFTYVH